MKILHIIDTLWIGGAQTVVKSIFEKQKDNKDIFLFALRKREINIEISHSNVFLYQSNAKYSFAPIKELKRIVKENNIDIIHCHLTRSQVFGYILKRFYFRKTKLIFHEHGIVFDNRILLPLLFYILKNKVDLFISCSRASKQALIKQARIKPEKVIVLYNSVNIDKFNKKNINWDIHLEREKTGIKEEEFVIGFTGRLVERKGWRELVKAANILKDLPKIKFLIAGDGPEKKDMLELIKKYELNDKIIFLGYVSNMVWFNSLLDCLVIPSYWEGLSLVQLEVMSMGIPLIICDGPGMNEVAKDNIDALYINIKDPEDLAAKINILVSNTELRNRLIDAGFDNVKKFSVDNFLNRLDEIYEDVLK